MRRVSHLGYSRLFQVIPGYSSLFQVIPCFTTSPQFPVTIPTKFPQFPATIPTKFPKISHKSCGIFEVAPFSCGTSHYVLADNTFMTNIKSKIQFVHNIYSIAYKKYYILLYSNSKFYTRSTFMIKIFRPPPPPNIDANIVNQEWELFKDFWRQYKTMTYRAVRYVI